MAHPQSLAVAERWRRLTPSSFSVLDQYEKTIPELRVALCVQACRSEPESLASKALGLYRTMRDEDRLKVSESSGWWES